MTFQMAGAKTNFTPFSTRAVGLTSGGRGGLGLFRVCVVRVMIIKPIFHQAFSSFCVGD